MYRSRHPWVLIVLGVALVGVAFFLYPGTNHDRYFYKPSVPGWISLLLFIVIGVLVQLGRSRDRKRDPGHKSEIKDLTKR
jgi:peptidoglycan/LPS O-acetylase OafA/YrhL